MKPYTAAQDAFLTALALRHAGHPSGIEPEARAVVLAEQEGK